ncbi:uncharacterized protein LAESUDRAFT_720123 [Laetiporus sulphureus 93-53]|uniref:Uncharacterized protein n=1 Tax=Laetiporus sulphureus 93-53 TaxID=1314785 RepID=A0A165HT46_9APHY|nr:uncharacterized protein LAESUDRAFT_720123 [Laetiporus sulphureus 93-53]KZT12152.1 hypothetical protein LAESUDRAFT_720123 [Laetiporus sulphureus 93-53]
MPAAPDILRKADLPGLSHGCACSTTSVSLTMRYRRLQTLMQRIMTSRLLCGLARMHS